jgi:hypothetical protein
MDAGFGYTFTDCVTCTLFPAVNWTVSVTVKVPVEVYVWVAVGTLVAVPPSPKVQFTLATVAGGTGTELSVKKKVDPRHWPAVLFAPALLPIRKSAAPSGDKMGVATFSVTVAEQPLAFVAVRATE